MVVVVGDWFSILFYRSEIVTILLAKTYAPARICCSWRLLFRSFSDRHGILPNADRIGSDAHGCKYSGRSDLECGIECDTRATDAEEGAALATVLNLAFMAALRVFWSNVAVGGME